METSPASPIDPALVCGARAGCDSARAALYGELGGSIFTLVRRILGSDAQAEDVLQDTFVEVFTRLDELRDDTAFAAWTRRIAVNRALSHLRSSWVSKRAGMPAELPADTAAATPCPLEAHFAAARLEAALDSLPDTARAVVWLYDVEGYTHQEIATLMGRSVSFSKTRLARAHESLRRMLGDGESIDEGNQICVGQLKTI